MNKIFKKLVRTSDNSTHSISHVFSHPTIFFYKEGWILDEMSIQLPFREN